LLVTHKGFYTNSSSLTGPLVKYYFEYYLM
jgi:hypothetical protein